MAINDKFFYINIRDYLALGNDDKAGEAISYIPCIFTRKQGAVGIFYP